MAKELNATCLICGKKYHVCEICDKNKDNWHSWRMIVDDISCYKLFTLLTAYSGGSKTKDEVKEFLETMDLSELETFAEIPKKQIKEILKSENKKENNKDNNKENMISEAKEDNITFVSEHKNKKEIETVKAKKASVSKQENK